MYRTHELILAMLAASFALVMVLLALLLNDRAWASVKALTDVLEGT
jgi:hypothetical protein